MICTPVLPIHTDFVTAPSSGRLSEGLKRHLKIPAKTPKRHLKIPAKTCATNFGCPFSNHYRRGKMQTKEKEIWQKNLVLQMFVRSIEKMSNGYTSFCTLQQPTSIAWECSQQIALPV